MSKYDNIIITTTSNFDNVEITNYFKPVTAHVVVGMNFFKDVFAGLSDIFGGNSSTYENTLASINKAVLNKLKQEAYTLGANCILGLKIDNDEVSSQGKSMMMVTAIGTAAKANFTKETELSLNSNKQERIDSDLLKMLVERQTFIESIKLNKYFSPDSLLQFATKHRLDEFVEYLTDHMIKYLDGINIHDAKERAKSYYEYYSSIKSDIAVKILYQNINSDVSPKIREILIGMIKELKLIEYGAIIDKLKSGDFQIQKSFAEICTFDKESFDKNDIGALEEVISIIEDKFKDRTTSAIKKSKLFQKETEVWTCTCEKENDSSLTHCANCKKDKFGFFSNEMTPIKAKEMLEFKIRVLKDFFDA